MLNIVCVQAGNYEGRGAQYVNVLFDMVARNLAEGYEGRFVCFTDNPVGIEPHIFTHQLPHLPQGHHKWWNKLYLFSAGAFAKGERVLYLDLDTLITGRLDEIASYDPQDGFVILDDFWRAGRLQSAVMAWRAGEHEHLWSKWLAQGMPQTPGGDQEWIEQNLCSPVKCWQSLFPGLFVSYKATEGRAPTKASVVCFHGLPRPHEVDSGWVPAVWKVGGITRAELDVICNTEREVYMANVRSACARDLPWFDFGTDKHDRQVAIVGGAPSVLNAFDELRQRQKDGQEIWALNNARSMLEQAGIEPDAQFVIDARALNAEFVAPHPTMRFYIASQCVPEIFEKLAGCNVTVMHMATEGMYEYLVDFPTEKPTHLLGGGTTVGLKAMLVAYKLGYKFIHVYGMDSSYDDEGAHHAYSQDANVGERIVEVICGDVKFRCAPWMVTQATDFQSLVELMIDDGVTVTVNGSGLIPHIAREMMRSPAIHHSDLRAYEILRRLEGVAQPRVAELGVFAGDLSKRLLARDDLHLTMVDAWGAYPNRERLARSGDFHATLSDAQQQGYKRMALDRIEFANGRSRVIAKDTSSASIDVPDESLDMVFIDADHSYEGCSTDIREWFPKVRPGGIIGGHDYENHDYPFGKEVRRAVDEFVTRTGLQLETGLNHTWFVAKPSTSLQE